MMMTADRRHKKSTCDAIRATDETEEGTPCACLTSAGRRWLNVNGESCGATGDGASAHTVRGC